VAAVGGRLAAIPPFSLFRSLALGRSHGLVVALATYADAIDLDLAGGRHIAATGGVRSDGSVTRIGGLPAKARAARRVGVDVFFFPAGQEGDLSTFDPGSMKLVPVASLDEAIDFLAGA
jgi:PDZ domain-containing secreted protein